MVIVKLGTKINKPIMCNVPQKKNNPSQWELGQFLID